MNGILTITLPTPFEVGPVNVYLLQGEPLTLVDAGVKTPAGEAALRQGLAAAGYELRHVRCLVLTHHHQDHAGLAGLVAAESGAEVLAHPFTARWLEDHEAGWERYGSYILQVFRLMGVPEGLTDFFKKISAGIKDFSGPVRVNRYLEDGDRLQLGGRWWEIIHTPGHSRGSICLYEPRSGTFLSGDHLLGHISSNPVMEPPLPSEGRWPASLAWYLDSLRRTLELDIKTALPSHGLPVADHRSLIRERFKHHQDRKERILEMLAGSAVTGYEIATRLFPGLRPQEVFLAISEVVGHLDLLLKEGHVVETWQDGLLLFSRKSTTTASPNL